LTKTEGLAQLEVMADAAGKWCAVRGDDIGSSLAERVNNIVL
jgi:hypothetical protein